MYRSDKCGGRTRVVVGQMSGRTNVGRTNVGRTKVGRTNVGRTKVTAPFKKDRAENYDVKLNLGLGDKNIFAILFPHTIYLCVCPSLSLSLSPSLSLSLSHFLSLTHSHFLSLSLSLTHTHILSFSIFLSLLGNTL